MHTMGVEDENREEGGGSATPVGRRQDTTPTSKIDSKGPPATPCKPRRISEVGSGGRRSFGSAARSLTPLFNGFSAAQQRAQQLGGRYGTISKRNRLQLDSSLKTRSSRVRKKTEMRTPGGQGSKGSVMSVHTIPQTREHRKNMLNIDKLDTESDPKKENLSNR
jgi:hypothetical protein